MLVKAYELFQGEDWFTYRPTVAQAFDTLDRLRTLCESGAIELGPLPTDITGKTVDLARHTANLVLQTLLGICDELEGEVEAVLAELAPHSHNEVSRRWTGVEMRQMVQTIRAQAMDDSATEMLPALMESVYSTAERIADALKVVDQ